MSNEELLDSFNVDLARANSLRSRTSSTTLWQRFRGQVPSTSLMNRGNASRFRNKASASGGALTAEREDWKIQWEDLEFGKVVGEGNVGAVHLGWWRGTTVAIKQLLPSWLSDRDMLTRFKDEIDLMAGMHHPNVLLFIGAVLEPSLGRICLVTEYCEHGSLYDYLHDISKPMSWKPVCMSIPYAPVASVVWSALHALPKYDVLKLEVRFLMATDTARGMLYLHHRACVIQRDLKSANLLIAEGFHIKIADFGLSRKLVPDGMDTYCGTPTNMAPEIVNQEPYSEKADVFSFGVILYELVTREDPYPKLSNIDGLALAFAVANDGVRPNIPSYCPRELADLMQRCWEGNPHKRPSFAAALKELVEMQEEVRKIREAKALDVMQRSNNDGSSVSLSLGVKDDAIRDAAIESEMAAGLFADAGGLGFSADEADEVHHLVDSDAASSAGAANSANSVPVNIIAGKVARKRRSGGSASLVAAMRQGMAVVAEETAECED